MSKKIQVELEKLTKLQPRPGEAAEPYTRRVMKKVNALADQDAANWEALSDAAQEWMNANTTADDEGQALALLELPEAGPAPTAEEAPPPNESDEVPTVAKTKTKTKTKAGSKKTPAKPKAAPPAKKAPAKTAAAPKTKAKAQNGTAERAHRPGRRPLFPDNGVITILQDDNPHRAGTIRDLAFKKMKNGMTVTQAVAAGVPRQQVWSCWKRGVISVKAA